MHWVKNAEYMHDHRILVEFEDGSSKDVDLAPYLDQGVFRTLKSIDAFKLFRVNHDTDTIEWENGADLSPDFLFDIGVSSSHCASKAA